MMLIADAKAGKTTLCFGLMWALTEGEPFLDRYQTNLPDDGKVCYLNYDMSPNEFRTYLSYSKWTNPDRLIIKHLLAGQFPFWEPEVFKRFQEFAFETNIHLLIFDTLQMASLGFVSNENDNTEMAAFIAQIQMLAQLCGIPHVLICHHRGRTHELRGRAASSIDGAVTGWWVLDSEDRTYQDDTRMLSAKGRGVGVRPVELYWDDTTKRYSVDKTGTGSGSTPYVVKVEDKNEKFVGLLVDWFEEHGEWPGT